MCMARMYLTIMKTVVLNYLTRSLFFLSKSILKNCDIFSLSLSGQVICTHILIKKSNKIDKKISETIKINRYFSSDHWPESIKKEFLGFLFQGVFSFTAKNIPE